jgi:MFS family permease
MPENSSRIFHPKNFEPNFLRITIANMVVRAAYQVGKTPLLPIFAASLGATDVFLGIIVSVSTLTGMLLKPMIGFMSDRWGRRLWLLVGTAFFAFMPFLYWLIRTPEQLFAIRIIHGIATAVYGPVTLAYIAEQWPEQRGERLGWFEAGRNIGYIVGPAAAGWLLLFLSPPAIFTIIGLISAVMFIPILALPESRANTRNQQKTSIWQQVRNALRDGLRTGGVWLAGSLDALTYVATYALKAFLPIYGLSIGLNVAQVGLYFAVQEAVSMVVKPFGGRLGDRVGYFSAITLGMAVLGVGFIMISSVPSRLWLFVVALLIGVGQAFIFPITTALVSVQVGEENVGAGMGAVGTLRNAGKVAGPVIGGLLIQRFDYAQTFAVLGGMLLVSALMILLRNGIKKSPTRQHSHAGD